MTKKIAIIVNAAVTCSDDGMALTMESRLFLNDNGGFGFWHGGPGYKNHCSTYPDEQSARNKAEILGYNVTDVRSA